MKKCLTTTISRDTIRVQTKTQEDTAMKNKTLAELLATMSIAQAKEILRTLTDNQREKAISDLIALYHTKTTSKEI